MRGLPGVRLRAGNARELSLYLLNFKLDGAYGIPPLTAIEGLIGRFEFCGFQLLLELFKLSLE